MVLGERYMSLVMGRSVIFAEEVVIGSDLADIVAKTGTLLRGLWKAAPWCCYCSL